MYPIKNIQAKVWGKAGALFGRRVVECSFSTCNLWSGVATQRDRGEAKCALYCDADFAKGRSYGLSELLESLDAAHDIAMPHRHVVLTGGEPLESADSELLTELVRANWNVTIETNGTIEMPAYDDEHRDPNYRSGLLGGAVRIVLSPKLGNDGQPLPVVVPWADEIHVVLPGGGWKREMLRELVQTWPGVDYYVTPEDPLITNENGIKLLGATALVRSTPEAALLVSDDDEEDLDTQWRRNLQDCLDLVMHDSRWRLSLPASKLAGLP